MAKRRFEWPVRVYYEDTDAGGVVYHASYLRFFERARTEFLRHLGFEQRRLKDQLGVLFAVRRMAVEFLKPAYFDDLLTVTVEGLGMGRVRVRLRQDLWREEERLCSAEVEVVCLDGERFRPVPLPALLVEALQRWSSRQSP